jgi:aryl-alcohol dehydrogenase-like predicted oxidoreductase
MILPGLATTAGTNRYRKRFHEKIPATHFHQSQGLWFSSIGIGTYLGNYDADTDQQYCEAVVRAVESGCNVIDSAINYRLQRSERSVGMALGELSAGGFNRDEIIVATKGGFIPYDGEPPTDAHRYFEETFVKPGVAKLSDVVGGVHCMTPSYLLNQLESSLHNLGLECVDIYYIHNPETQLGKLGRAEFSERLFRAFQALEGAAAAGKIRIYGTATWNGYRRAANAEDYLSLAEMVEIAAKAGGTDHHFKAIQLPLNLGMTEALSLTNQLLEGNEMTILQAAEALGMTVVCSASILQGQLTHNLPRIIANNLTGLETDGQRALQFVRSTPGVTTALVGMKQLKHVDENLHTACVPPASWEAYSKLFEPAPAG